MELCIYTATQEYIHALIAEVSIAVSHYVSSVVLVHGNEYDKNFSLPTVYIPMGKTDNK